MGMTDDDAKQAKGLHVFRKERFNLSCVTTFDVRMRTPYEEEPLNPPTVHTLVHCIGAYLRRVRQDVIYVGAMGSMTGLRVVVAGDKVTANIRSSLIDAFEDVLRTDAIPGATRTECGLFSFMDLSDARGVAASYLDILRQKP